MLCVAFETGFEASLVLSTLPERTIALVTPTTIPEKGGLANGVFRSEALCIALETGSEASLVLPTLPKLTIALATPTTVH